jgi:kexin
VNNSLCGAGIAYGATVSGVRYVGFQTPVSTATALTAHSTNIGVSSNSWGVGQGLGSFYSEPQASFDAFYTLASRRIPVVIAAGNEGDVQSMCSHNEITNSAHQIVVGAINDHSKKSIYSSECANLFISAPSNDRGYRDSVRLGIIGAQNGGGCTTSFGGTSASTPAVSGVIALMKQAKPTLTFRDIQAILMQNADRIDAADPSWVQNAAGKWHSNKYGFGKVNAYNSVAAAKTWTPLTRSEYYTTTDFTGPFHRSPNTPIPDGTGAVASDSLTVQLREGSVVEHVTVYLKTDHISGNQFEITLTSPSGTVSLLSSPFAAARIYSITGTNDGSSKPLIACPFTSSTGITFRSNLT